MVYLTIKIRNTSLTLILLFASSMASAEGNAKLASLMRCLSKDVSVVTAPTKVSVPAEVTEEQILDAMIRTQSVRFFLNEFNAKKGKIENSTFITSVYTPFSISTFEGAKAEDALLKISIFIKELSDKMKLIKESFLLSAQIAI